MSFQQDFRENGPFSQIARQLAKHEKTLNELLARTQASGGSGGATTRVRAYANSNDAISGAFSKIALDAEDFDVDGEFSTVNNRFTATQAGYYLVVATLTVPGMSAGGYIGIRIKKNGTTDLLTIYFTAPVATTGSLQVLDLYSLAAADYIEMYGISSANLNITGNNSSTFMAIVGE